MQKIRVKLDDGKPLWVTKIDKDDVSTSMYSNNAVEATEENLEKCRKIYPEFKFSAEETK